MPDLRGQTLTCARCGETSECTPWNDFYTTPFWDGPGRVDEKCFRELVAQNTGIARHIDVDDLVPTCSLCRRKRTLEDAYDYHPIQAITGKALGWYSGDDGEVCPGCMEQTLRGEVQ